MWQHCLTFQLLQLNSSREQVRPFAIFLGSSYCLFNCTEDAGLSLDDFLDGKLMKSIVRALGMNEKEEERSSRAILRFILLLQEAVPTYFQHYTHANSSLNHMIQPQNHIMWQVSSFEDDLECNPGSLFDALQ